MAGCSGIQSDGLAEGGGLTSRAMSTSTTPRPVSARNLTWQPSQGIRFTASSATQKYIDSTKPNNRESNKRGIKGTPGANTKASISTTASLGPESSNKALPLFPFRPCEAVSTPSPNPSTVFDIPVEDYGGRNSQDVDDIDRAFGKAEERLARQPLKAIGQTRSCTSIIFEDGSGSDAESFAESAVTLRGQELATRLVGKEEDKVQEKTTRNLKIEETKSRRKEVPSRMEEKVSWDVKAKERFQKLVAMNQQMDSVQNYWYQMGLLDWNRMGLLSTSRRRMRRFCDRIRADSNKLLDLSRNFIFTGSSRTEDSTITPTNPIHDLDYEPKDVEEADVGLSAQNLSGSSALNLCPTSKLSSPCSAVAVGNESGQASDSDAESLDYVADHNSMVYQIPDGVMREAMLASSSTGAAYWQYSLYQEGGDPSGDKVKVHYCTSKETTERIAQLFLDKEVIGFDIEWKPQAQVGEGIKKNVSLIQLASEERIALFHIARYTKGDTIDDLLAPSLKKIMESSEISKVGVSVKADCTRLRRFLGIEARGLFELSHLYKLIKYSAGDVKKINKVLVALAQQVEEHLLLPMWKGEVRSSDWSQKLDYEQIKYAASDSYAGLRLYDVMEGKRKALQPPPPRPAHAELNRPIILANGKTVATYDELDELKDEKPTEDVSAHPADVEEMARDFVDIELEDSKIKPPTTSKSAARSSRKSPEITAAETWVTNWRSRLPPGYRPRALPSQLRAYALWSELSKDVAEVAEILRDPPLQVTTVANYISDAIRLEKLPFQEHRLEKVWELLPTRAPGRGWRPQGGR